jgi:hypothetical protein
MSTVSDVINGVKQSRVVVGVKKEVKVIGNVGYLVTSGLLVVGLGVTMHFIPKIQWELFVPMIIAGGLFIGSILGLIEKKG